MNVARDHLRSFVERIERLEEEKQALAADIRDTGGTVASVEAAGGRIAGVPLDVADMASCENMAAVARDRFGRIDILVNNAALYGDISGGRFDALS